MNDAPASGMDHSVDQPSELDGRWVVRRVSGLLPPRGISKQIDSGRGLTRILGIPWARFDVHGRALQYLRLPLHDELEPAAGGNWIGDAYLWRWRYCRFSLHRPQLDHSSMRR